MVKTAAVVLLLATVATVAQNVHYEEVVPDTNDFDLLYTSTSGPHNETWYFRSAINLASIVIPSQIYFCNAGPWPSGTYREVIDLFVYETRLATAAPNVQTYLVGAGSFNGVARFGQKLDIPVRNATLGTPPLIRKYVGPRSGYRYTVNIVFRMVGTYPWYKSRRLVNNSVVHTATNGSGIVTGLSYTVR